MEDKIDDIGTAVIFIVFILFFIFFKILQKKLKLKEKNYLFTYALAIALIFGAEFFCGFINNTILPLFI